MAQAGEYALACSTLERVIDMGEQRKRSGFGMGMLYEARARVAIWMDNRAAFDRYAEQSALAYATSKNPAFGAPLARLFDEARRRSIVPSDNAVAVHESLRPAAAESEYETVHSRIAECVDRDDRGRCALTLLLQSTTSASGHLYATSSLGALERIASLPEGASEPGMDEWAERHARVAFDQENDGATTGDEPDTRSDPPPDAQPTTRYRDRDSRFWQARPLFDGPTLAGVLVLPVEGAQTALPRELCEKVAHELVEHGDATGWRPF